MSPPRIVSGSEDVAYHVTSAPGSAGESSQNPVKLGRWFTTNGDMVTPEPCLYEELHAGVPAFPSQINAYHMLFSESASCAVYTAVACVESVVAPDTAY